MDVFSQVGTGWDQKERVFRNFAKMIGPKDDPVLVHRWLHGEPFDVKIMWIDPINVITGIYEMHVVDNWVISFHKPVFKKPMRPGRWTIKLVYSDKVRVVSRLYHEIFCFLEAIFFGCHYSRKCLRCSRVCRLEGVVLSPNM